MSEQDTSDFQKIDSWGKRNVQGWENMNSQQKKDLYDFDRRTTRQFQRNDELNAQIRQSRENVKKSLRDARKFLALAVSAVIAYPTILGITDHLLPSGNLPLDIGKYTLEFALAGIATGAVAAERKRRKQLDIARRELHDVRKRSINNFLFGNENLDYEPLELRRRKPRWPFHRN